MHDLALRLDRERFEPEVLCLYGRGPFSEDLEASAIPVRTLGVDRRVAPRNWLRTWGALGEVRADVVHTHLPEAAWYALPGAYLRRSPVRISHLHNTHWYWPAKLRRLDRAASAFASLSLACSTAVRDFARDRLHYPAGKLEVLRNALDLSPFESLPTREAARRSLDLPQDSPILTCVASLDEQKGHEHLLEALVRIRAEAPGVRLLVVGDGESAIREGLEEAVRRKGLEQAVTFLGTRHDVPLLLAASDVFVLASLWEGLPMVLAEAGAAGVPAVATSVGGVPEIVEDGVTGLLAPAGDPDRLAGAVLALLADPQRRLRMGEAARRRVTTMFDIQMAAARLEELYLDLLDRNGSRWRRSGD